MPEAWIDISRGIQCASIKSYPWPSKNLAGIGYQIVLNLKCLLSPLQLDEDDEARSLDRIFPPPESRRQVAKHGSRASVVIPENQLQGTLSS